MEVLAFLSAILIGVMLGLIGGGGSILTVPVLVYLFNVDAVLATSYSLFVVGLTSAVGSVSYFKNQLIHFKTAIVFGIPAIVSVYLTRHYLIPIIPNEIFTIQDFSLTKNSFLLLLFAVLMLLASYSMIKKTAKKEQGNEEIRYNYPLILIEGLVVGLLTGLVGAGGGFLIIPALVVLSKLPMKMAIGTSLLIIAAKSLFGFLGAIQSSNIDWKFLLLISSLAIIGIFIGIAVSKKVNGQKLKPAFGWFTLIMAIVIILKELL